jgi:hypothetical protein
METEFSGQAIFIFAIVKGMFSLLIYYAIDTTIVRFSRRITTRVSDHIMIPLGLSAVAVVAAGVAMLVAKAHGML